MLERTDAITKEVLEPIKFVLAYSTVQRNTIMPTTEMCSTRPIHASFDGGIYSDVTRNKYDMKFITSCHETKTLVTLSRLGLLHTFFVKTQKRERNYQKV
jgi:hypothetical protein